MNEAQTPATRAPLYQNLRYAIELYYDFQQARISYHHRAGDPNETENLSPADKEFMLKLGTDAEKLEKSILKHAAKSLKGHAIYEWLIGQRGIADTFAVILLGMIDIHKSETVSGLWRVCGLAVDGNGRAERRIKGQKVHYSPHLKTRMYLLGESFLKASNTEWRPFYDDYKARKQKQIGPCMLCGGTGTWSAPEEEGDAADPELLAIPPELRGKKKSKKCPRCVGTGQAPWGRSDKHLHIASMRYMVKMFLIELHRRWRTHEGLAVREPYSSEYHERMKRPGGAQP
jgi:hypothetical protein